MHWTQLARKRSRSRGCSSAARNDHNFPNTPWLLVHLLEIKRSCTFRFIFSFDKWTIYEHSSGFTFILNFQNLIITVNLAKSINILEYVNYRFGLIRIEKGGASKVHWELKGKGGRWWRERGWGKEREESLCWFGRLMLEGGKQGRRRERGGEIDGGAWRKKWKELKIERIEKDLGIRVQLFLWKIQFLFNFFYF